MRYIISSVFASLLGSVAAAEVPRVLTDIPPVASLVALVLGDLATPGVLVDQGADAHDVQLRPSKAAEIADAAVIFWIGPEMSPWLAETLITLAPKAVHLRLLGVPGTTLRQTGGTTEAQVEHTPPAGDAGHGDHAHPGTDPHAWLDPANAAVWLTAIAGELAALDPENAATYAANADSARTALADLEADLTARLIPARGTPLVVFHDAYGYFAARFGLTVIGAIAYGDAAAPGAAHLRDLQGDMAGRTVCLFPEANHDARQVAMLAEATGARVGTALDPEGATLPAGPGLYAAILRQMAEAIAICAQR